MMTNVGFHTQSDQRGDSKGPLWIIAIKGEQWRSDMRR